MLEYIITNHPWAKVGIIITNAIATGYTNYIEALKNVAKKWGIPYLDLQSDYSVPLVLDVVGKTDVCATAKALRNNQFYVSESNHHPNVRAHKAISTVIENWMRSL